MGTPWRLPMQRSLLSRSKLPARQREKLPRPVLLLRQQADPRPRLRSQSQPHQSAQEVGVQIRLFPLSPTCAYLRVQPVSTGCITGHAQDQERCCGHAENFASDRVTFKYAHFPQASLLLTFGFPFRYDHPPRRFHRERCPQARAPADCTTSL